MILTPRIEVSTRRGPRYLSFTMASLFHFEAETGRSLAGGVEIDLRDVRALLCALLKPFHPETKARDVAALWSNQELPGILNLGMTIITSSLPDPKGRAAVAEQAAGQSDWLRIWAIGRFDMRFSEEEFWLLTPSMFAAVIERISAAAGVEPEPTVEEKSARILSKIEQINAAWGGRDLRKNK